MGLRAFWEGVKEWELFAIIPAPRFERRSRFGSSMGVFVSLIVLGCAIGYAVYSISRLVGSETPSVSRTSASDAVPFPMDPFVLTLPNINDPSYFTTLVEWRTQAPGQRSSKVVLDLHAFSDRLEFANRSDVFLQGDCRVVLCKYVRVKVFPCQNSSTNPVVCKPPDVIERVVNTNYLLLEISGKTTEGAAVSRAYDLSLKDGLSFRQRFMFDVFYTKTYGNLLTSWRTQKSWSLQLEPPLFSIDRLPRLKTGDDTEYCKIDFMLTGVQVTEKRRFRTSLDVIGEIGAFFGAILGVAALVMTAYNEHRFYSVNTGWTAFDSEFKQLPPENLNLEEQPMADVASPPPSAVVPTAAPSPAEAQRPGKYYQAEADDEFAGVGAGDVALSPRESVS